MFWVYNSPSTSTLIKNNRETRIEISRSTFSHLSIGENFAECKFALWNVINYELTQTAMDLHPGPRVMLPMICNVAYHREVSENVVWRDNLWYRISLLSANKQRLFNIRLEKVNTKSLFLLFSRYYESFCKTSFTTSGKRLNPILFSLNLLLKKVSFNLICFENKNNIFGYDKKQICISHVKVFNQKNKRNLIITLRYKVELF